MRQVSSPVRRGARGKGRKDLARSLPGYDHHFAVKSGLKDGVIVHGLLTAGWLAQLLTDWLPSPLALKKFGVSYRSMARPGDTITCTGTIVNKYEKDGLHLLDCDIAAENQRGEKCAIGNATVALPRRS